MFFILSGFVMGLVHGRDFEGGFTWTAYKGFLMKRIARIYPLYFFVLSATLAFYIIVPARVPEETSNPTFLDAIENYFLIQAWGLNKSYVAQSWSISTEFGAYILFPALIYMTLVQSSKKTLLIAFFALLGIAILPFIFSGETKEPNLDIWQGDSFGPLCRCILEFTMGLLCYRFFKLTQENSFLNKSWPGVVLTIIIAILLFFRNSDILIVILLPWLILSLTSDQTPLARLLGGKTVHWLGLISYSVYLVHNLVFYFREDIQAGLEKLNAPHAYSISLAACLPLVIFAGSLAHYFIEKPMRNIIRQKFEGKKPRIAEALI